MTPIGLLNMATFDQFISSIEQDFGEQGKGKPFEVFCMAAAERTLRKPPTLPRKHEQRHAI